MQILVTGGCGFIGSHLAEALVAAGHAVTVLDDLSTGKRANLPPQARLVEGDIADAATLQAACREAEAIFHLAAIASVPVCEQEPARAERTNVAGTALIFEAAAARAIPVIYASSAAIYGDNDALPLVETAVPRPLSLYGNHKLTNERMAAAAWQARGVRSAGLRFFNVYGPRQDPSSPYSGVISKFAAQLHAGQPLTFFGDGGQTRDFIYVGDIVRLLLAAWQQAKAAGLYNGCTGTQTSLRQLADQLGRAMSETPVTQLAEARTGDIRHSCGDPSRAKAELGFTATTTLADGLRQLVEAP